jgi:hypothetical protein
MLNPGKWSAVRHIQFEFRPPAARRSPPTDPSAHRQEAPVTSIFKGPSAPSVILAAAFVLVAMLLGFRNIGLPPVVIVGGSGVVGLALWIRTYRHGPIDPAIILPPFLLTVACLEGHMIEEYTMGFGPAMSRLFNISWSEHSFLLIFTFIGPILYALTALGLFFRVPIAGFLAWFIFIGPGVAEFTHFIFPMLQPSIQPHNLAAVTAAVKNGHVIADMPNYYFGVTGRYYFPGLYTAVLPMIPGIYGIVACLRTAQRAARSSTQPAS